MTIRKKAGQGGADAVALQAQDALRDEQRKRGPHPADLPAEKSKASDARAPKKKKK